LEIGNLEIENLEIGNLKLEVKNGKLELKILMDDQHEG
jgi:hypothetical protein